MTFFKTQMNLFLIALAFFTRIPVSRKVDFSRQNLNHASRYFSLIGWIIGGICAAIFILVNYFLPIEIAVLLSMLFGVLITGCFHEDGLADTCDGFGGGWNKKEKLSIMKDSRLGTYGAAAIWFVLTLKFSLLVSIGEIASETIVIALLIAHPLSRSTSTSILFFLPYVTEGDQSKVKPLAEKQNFTDFSISLSVGMFGLFLVPQVALPLSLALLVSYFLMMGLFNRQIGGFTGDTLGAAQQVSEIVIYIVLLTNSISLASGL